MGSWFSWLCGEVHKENFEKKDKTDRRKTLNNENKVKNIYFAQKHSSNQEVRGYKEVYTITFYLQFLKLSGYLKLSNDTPKLVIHKYNNYNVIEIFINRLNTKMQIFMAMDYLILMSEK